MDFTKIETPISKEEILSKIPVIDLWYTYCEPFKNIDTSFCSELYDDENPSARVVISCNNTLYYKDFGNGDYFGDIFDYIQNKYKCTFYESLNIIAADFGLRKNNISNDYKNAILELGQMPVSNINVPEKIKSNIYIVSQAWNIVDYEYWSKYGITFDLLNEYNVFAAKHVYLSKGDKRNVFDYRKNNPCYAYRFTNDVSYSYKIYFPMADKKFKWLFSGGSQKDIEGIDQIPLHGETLILTKSLKDCMCYRVIGLPAISLQGETNKLDSELVNKLLKRFDRIIVNYDNDEEGMRGSIKLNEQYGFDYFFVEETKDLSDYICKYSVDDAKQMIKRLIGGVENKKECKEKA